MENKVFECKCSKCKTTKSLEECISYFKDVVVYLCHTCFSEVKVKPEIV